MTTEAPLVLSELALLRLLQVSSPTFPVGAYAYSQGLEKAVELGWVADASSLVSWLSGLLRCSIARLDLPILVRAYRAWSNDDRDAALRVSALLLSSRGSRELVEEEQHLGSALARVLCHLEIEEARPFIGNPKASYPMLFALAAVHWKIALRAALGGYALLWAENQVNAASRLFPLGQLACQKTLAELLTRAPQAITESMKIEDHEIGSLAPAQAIASALHEQQYTRLFRS
jgi:urease accessory protein